jgi:outer membrane protein assembly factor BamD
LVAYISFFCARFVPSSLSQQANNFLERMNRPYIGYGLVLILLAGVLLSSCDPCRRLRKSKNLADRDSAAYCYFKRKQYESSSLILDQLKGMYRGTASAEKAMFYYAQCKYYMGEATLSAFYFTEYVQTFPSGKYAEEALYMVGKSYYSMSGAVELEQKETEKAIEYYELYLQQFPVGTYSTEVQQTIKDLRAKMALKAFNQADLYYKIYRYRSAMLAFKNMLADFPDSPYREKAQFRLFVSAFYFATNSVEEKKKPRLIEAMELYQRFIDRFPNSEYVREAEAYYSQIQASLEGNTQKLPKKDKQKHRKIQMDEPER